MVGYNRIPTQRLRADARFPRGAGQAKRRQLAASGDLTPSASHRSLHPLLHYSPHRRSPVTPPKPHRARYQAAAVVRSLPPLSPRALPADSTAHTHTVRKPPRRFPPASFASSASLSLCDRSAHRPCLPSPGQGNAGSLRIQTTEHEVTTRQI